MSEPAQFNRPANPANAISPWAKEVMARFGECYRRAIEGDRDAACDLVQVAIRAAEAIERLEAEYGTIEMSTIAKAMPAWPVRARGGEGEFERLKQRISDLAVGAALTGQRAPRGEWCDETNPINRASLEIRRIVREMWNADGPAAKKLGRLSLTNSRNWFKEAWSRYMERCSGDLAKDAFLQADFERRTKAAKGNSDSSEGGPITSSTKAIPPSRSRGESPRALDGSEMLRKQDAERKAVILAEKMLKSAHSAVTRTLRGEVLRSFERWRVIEPVA